ncbi:MAG: hypothetical protein WA049_08640 [Ferribacterium limneticum]
MFWVMVSWRQEAANAAGKNGDFTRNRHAPLTALPAAPFRLFGKKWRIATVNRKFWPKLKSSRWRRSASTPAKQ